jgi:hypothetical protein
MPIRMAKLTRSKNGDFVSRKGIPADVRETYTRLHRGDAKGAMRVTRAGGTPTAPKVGEELFKRPGSTSPSAAKVAWAEWCAEIDTRVASLRAAAKGEGRPLTQQKALVLAGKWYSWFLGQHEADTHLASHWAELRDCLIWDVIGREAPVRDSRSRAPEDSKDSFAFIPAVRVAADPEGSQRLSRVHQTASVKIPTKSLERFGLCSGGRFTAVRASLEGLGGAKALMIPLDYNYQPIAVASTQAV